MTAVGNFNIPRHAWNRTKGVRRAYRTAFDETLDATDDDIRCLVREVEGKSKKNVTCNDLIIHLREMAGKPAEK